MCNGSFLLYFTEYCRRWNGCRRRRAKLKLVLQKKVENAVKRKMIGGGIFMNARRNRNQSGELITVEQCCQESNLGRNTVRRLAREAGAERKIGRCYRIKRDAFFDYIEREYV